ncbi:MAG: hypothetical protein M0Z30_20425 [Actinomycetota bacterium]|nr:hypothetical protein [Actinomycetota bacterium]
MSQPKIDWTSGVLVDGPFEGKTVYCENRIGATVHFNDDITYTVVTLAAGGQPADL